MADPRPPKACTCYGHSCDDDWPGCSCPHHRGRGHRDPCPTCSRRPPEAPGSPGGPCGCRTERVRGPTQGGCDIPDRILYCPLHRDAKATARRLAEVEAERDALRDAAALALAWFERGGMSAGEIEEAALRAALASASPTAPAPKGGEGA